MKKEQGLSDIPGIWASLPLTHPLMKNIERDLPLNPIDRCHERWENLFWGVWKALYKHKPALIHGLLESMRIQGLVNSDYESSDLFLQNPPDSVLKEARIFREVATIPNLKGKGVTSPLNKDNPHPFWLVLVDYESALDTVSRVRQRTRHPGLRLLTLKEHLPRLLASRGFKRRDSIPDIVLKRWINKQYPPRDLAMRLIAYIYGLTPRGYRRRLTQARKKYPEIVNALKQFRSFVDLQTSIRVQTHHEQKVSKKSENIQKGQRSGS